MDIREIRQQEAADSFKNQGIIMASPRFGKIRTTIKILQKEKPSKILITYPNTPIKDSWVNDFKKWGYEPPEVVYTTFASLKKYVDEDWDFFIIDEIHEASRNQLFEMGRLVRKKVKTLGLSGTITKKTEMNIFYNADLALCYDYSIEQAVEEGILCDYEIFVHKVPLSTSPDGRYTDSKKKPISEKKKFDSYLYVMDKTSKKSKQYFMLELKVINLIQNSISKLEKTKELLQKFQNDRVLVFCGTTEIADSLGIPSYHSKAKEKQLFEDFCSGKGDHLATIKMAQAGVTVLPINKGLINYTSGNPENFAQMTCRFLGLEYDNLDKKAEIHVICSQEPFESFRLKTALQFFDFKKIKYVE